MPLFVGCGEPEPRPQWVLVIDTDAPLTGQIVSEPLLPGPEFPTVAAIDSLLVEILGEDGRVIDERQTVAADERDWPLSFGVVVEEGRTRIRIRAFQGQSAVPDDEGRSVPAPRQTIDRLVVLEPASDKRTVRLTLALGCMGRPPSFVSPERTCVDQDHPDELATAGLVETSPGVPTVAGTSPWLAEEPCLGVAPPGSVCIPGGFDLLGDQALRGFEDLLAIDAAPPLPVRVSPVYMDRYEVSQGEVRALYQAGLLTAPEPFARDPGNPDQVYCNWLGVDDASRDTHPVNCVGVSTAEAICAARGGRLPTEAEWEHAARGRGRGQARPWGDADPICCATKAAVPFCQGLAGTAPVDAYEAPFDCALADVSRDGVVGLAGNVGELTRDAADRYDGDCWQYVGVPRDPVCDLPDLARIVRGGDWANSLSLTHGAFRVRYLPSGAGGVRCVYDATGARR